MKPVLLLGGLAALYFYFTKQQSAGAAPLTQAGTTPVGTVTTPGTAPTTTTTVPVSSALQSLYQRMKDTAGVMVSTQTGMTRDQWNYYLAALRGVPSAPPEDVFSGFDRPSMQEQLITLDQYWGPMSAYLAAGGMSGLGSTQRVVQVVGGGWAA